MANTKEIALGAAGGDCRIEGFMTEVVPAYCDCTVTVAVTVAARCLLHDHRSQSAASSDGWPSEGLKTAHQCSQTFACVSELECAPGLSRAFRFSVNGVCKPRLSHNALSSILRFALCCVLGPPGENVLYQGCRIGVLMCRHMNEV